MQIITPDYITPVCTSRRQSDARSVTPLELGAMDGAPERTRHGHGHRAATRARVIQIIVRCADDGSITQITITDDQSQAKDSRTKKAGD